MSFKAELSGWPAQTKLMAFGYKAELSSLSAQTKLMPYGYKELILGIVHEIHEKILVVSF
ncbi:hypothetical protein [Candidatus Methylobacter oryzae]|uniref:hypothetical protein n=1 Tax=Candidatus Methylobacter oryzae TaxID=2497749 RepID=UPI000F8EF8AE|nr:hypothetical protein [Candidatus Methylobacter oryzae]